MKILLPQQLTESVYRNVHLLQNGSLNKRIALESQFTLHPEFEAFSSARHQMSVRRRISGSFSLHWGILGMVFIMALAIGLLKTVREYR
jgi:hypothetical protein